MRRLLAAAVLSLAFACPTSAQQPTGSEEPLLTLDAATREALKHNRPLEIVNLDVLRSQESVASTKTRRLPSTKLYLFGSELLTRISFTFHEGVFGNTSIGPIPATDTKITTPRRPNVFMVAEAGQPLTQLYKIGLAINQQQLAVTMNRERVRLARQSVVNDVKQSYYQILQSQAGLAATEESVKFYQELDRVVGERVAQQAELLSSSLEVKARLANEQYNALQLRNSLATQKEYLNDILGRDIRTAYRVEEVPEPAVTETNLEAAQNRALAQRPEVHEAEIQVKQAETDRRQKKAEYIPDLSFTLHYLSPFNVNFIPQNIAAAGLELSWEPWDWGRKQHELREKDFAIQQAQVQLAQMRNQVLLDINQRFRKLEEARALLGVAQAKQQAAKEKLRVASNQYAQKAVLLTDVLQQQSALSDANRDYQRALSSFWSARADLEKALGEDY